MGKKSKKFAELKRINTSKHHDIQKIKRKQQKEH